MGWDDLTSFPGRPQHPDMIELMSLALQLDGQATEGGRKVPDIVGEYVDSDSLTYLANQRAMLFTTMAGKSLGSVSVRQRVKTMLGAVYLEAFVMGVRWARDRD